MRGLCAGRELKVVFGDDERTNPPTAAAAVIDEWGVAANAFTVLVLEPP